ncbi:threonine transporter RhtB [Vreelandella aquamarina]|jgi:threonine/homoserine/homoserine lactone efflux protein|uniref:Threonine transporter RhtB n=1 Tax=Vreelandella aquamarina TaxID=77097 RepID=A0A1N6H8H7_9GAMM|nr:MULTISPECIES: LysE family translocator [Halomonas]MEC9019736.1 LysE family translocator [Pseudomonadota bacterium]MCC4291648.1 LysE family translocator [Halomonas axialensis]MCF2912536.1 LysE family translocator [Halomonas sp. Cn5-12]MCO7241673.1 LysE family translocator [Halomonas sp. Ps84H-12]MCP1303489.1 LysE family translocator [Halomonas sp. R1t8]|tara:strand:- start:512 stop:1135 length:624 start_codon:yes stop_codon:yes gene_type:complete
MMSWATLSVFIPTFLFVSLTPGMCMTLAMVLGMTQGVKRTLWMMVGELIGVGFVAAAAGAGVAALMLRQPELFIAFKWVGGAYLAYLGIMMWRSRGRMAIPSELDTGPAAGRLQLATQGLVTAVANPKGWAFFMVLLPPFLDGSRPLAPQLSMLIAVILTIEFASMLVYATGGKTLRKLLGKSGNVRLLNRIAGTLMIGVGMWLALG